MLYDFDWLTRLFMGTCDLQRVLSMPGMESWPLQRDWTSVSVLWIGWHMSFVSSLLIEVVTEGSC